jgi:hypothetical protein
MKRSAASASRPEGGISAEEFTKRFIHGITIKSGWSNVHPAQIPGNKPLRGLTHTYIVQDEARMPNSEELLKPHAYRWRWNATTRYTQQAPAISRRRFQRIIEGRDTNSPEMKLVEYAARHAYEYVVQHLDPLALPTREHVDKLIGHVAQLTMVRLGRRMKGFPPPVATKFRRWVEAQINQINSDIYHEYQADELDRTS